MSCICCAGSRLVLESTMGRRPEKLQNRMNINSRHLKIILILAAFLLVVRAIYESIRLRWIADDAFISFRYALNMVRGNGLVFNAEEKVEGFTNFLWTILMALGLRINLSAELFSMILSIGCYASLLLFLLAKVYYAKAEFAFSSSGTENPNRDSRENRNSRMGSYLLPLLALILLAGMHHMHVFATSGLETMAFALFVSAGVYFIWLRPEPLDAMGLWSLTVACLLRPDGAIVLAVAWLYASGSLLSRRKKIVSTDQKQADEVPPGMHWMHLGTTALVLILYQAWRLYYYDSFFPNTFYAKSAYDPYPHQGMIYLRLFYQSYWYLPILLALASFLAFRTKVNHRWWIMLLVILLWHGYVIWVGGDFMFGRFLVPILPAMAMTISWPLASALESLNTGERLWISETPIPEKDPSEDAGKSGANRPWPIILTGCLLLLPFLRWDPYSGLKAENQAPEIRGIVEERLYYPRKEMEELAEVARSYSGAIRKNNIRLAFHGGAAFLIYYMDPEYALEASTGLTDRRLARQILSDRGRIGHEKEATLDYMQKREVDIYMWPPNPDGKERTIRFQGFWEDWQIIKNDPEKIQPLLDHPSITMPYSN